jgi:iron complex transport system substrate-binding protein
MQLEDFYDAAKDADYLIYNSAIDGGVTSVEELLKKCGVLKDFKAVKEGNVWCTSQDLYQQTLSIGYLILDIHGMLTGEAEEKMNYLFRCRDTTAK